MSRRYSPTLSCEQVSQIYRNCEEPSAPADSLSLPALIATLVILVLGCALAWALGA